MKTLLFRCLNAEQRGHLEYMRESHCMCVCAVFSLQGNVKTFLRYNVVD